MKFCLNETYNLSPFIVNRIHISYNHLLNHKIKNRFTLCIHIFLKYESDTYIRTYDIA